MSSLPLRLEPVGGPETTPQTLNGDEPFHVGRARESQICLAGTTVSRQHAMVLRRDGTWFLRDLGSRHGTFLNGVRLDPDTLTQLDTGDLLRLGPFTFRILLGDATFQPERTIDMAIAPGIEVRRATDAELESLAARRLQVLVECSDSFAQARDEDELAQAVLDAALDGTRFPRGAVLRMSGEHEAPEVVVSRGAPSDGGRPFAFSHSLLREASIGEVVHLAPSDAPAYGHSINLLGIHTAVCAPIMVDGAPAGAVYLDARESELVSAPDAVAYCHALGRIAGLAYGALRRSELRARQARLEEDLRLARQAQAFLGSTGDGTIGHVQYAVQSHPGWFIAGDLFDIFALDDDRVAFCIGDVSGQGLRAGILMTAILAHIRSTMIDTHDPADVTERLNRFVSARTEAGMFASMVIGVFDRTTSTLRFVDAGHGHWFVRRAGAGVERAPRPGGLLIGIQAEFAYTTQSIDLAEGDRVILFSDGIVEHRSDAGSEFGTERLRRSLTDATSPTEDVADAFFALRAFIGETPLADDTTLASIQIVAAP